MIDNCTEYVSGNITSCDFVTAELFYDNRKQSGIIRGDNEDEIRSQSKKYIEKLKRMYGKQFSEIYPEKKWSIRYYN